MLRISHVTQARWHQVRKDTRWGGRNVRDQEQSERPVPTPRSLTNGHLSLHSAQASMAEEDANQKQHDLRKGQTSHRPAG